MYLKMYCLILAAILPLYGHASAEEMDKAMEEVKNCTALIPLCPREDPDKNIQQGCGVVFQEVMDGKPRYFIATVYHLVEQVYSRSDIGLKPIVKDWNGRRLWPEKLLGKESIVCAEKAADFAVIELPGNLAHEPWPEEYKFPGLAYLKSIARPDRVKLGQDVYMLGYRPFTKVEFLYVLKKGILSSIMNRHPGFGNAPIYFVDKMPNKGMSGGPVFYSTGEGLGLIHGYLTEIGSPSRLSDDLTVVVPYSYILGKLREKLTQAK